MRAAAIERFGGPAALTLHTLSTPRPGRQEVLIAVHAAGAGVWDASIRDGSWRPAGRAKFPLVLGTADARLRKLEPDGIDAALALANSGAIERLLDHVSPGGRVAFPNRVEPEPRRRPRIRFTAYDAELGPREFAKLDRAVEDAKLRVPIAAVYPLEQAAKAHERLEQEHAGPRSDRMLRGFRTRDRNPLRDT